MRFQPKAQQEWRFFSMIIATSRLQKLSSLSISYLHEDRIVNQVSFGKHSNVEERDKLRTWKLCCNITYCDLDFFYRLSADVSDTKVGK